MILNNFLKFLGLEEIKNTNPKPKTNEKNKKESISEKKIKMIEPIYKQDISVEIDYDTNEEIKITKTIIPINNKEAILNIKTEKIKLKGKI